MPRCPRPNRRRDVPGGQGRLSWRDRRGGDMSARRYGVEPTCPLVVRGSERWWFFGGWCRGWDPAQCPGFGGAGDPARGGDVQGAVGFHGEPPALEVSLEAVVGAAQAAQVG